MEVYIPKEILKNVKNEEKIRKILDKVPDGDVRIEGEYSLGDALKEIEGLGEDEIANLITAG